MKVRELNVFFDSMEGINSNDSSRPFLCCVSRFKGLVLRSWDS